MLCVRCGAPLPFSPPGPLACPFCRVVNQVPGPLRREEIREVVREVVAEEGRGHQGLPHYLEAPRTFDGSLQAQSPRAAPNPKATALIVVAGVASMVIMGALSAFVTLLRAPNRYHPPPTRSSSVPSVPAVPPRPAPLPPPPTWGVASALTVDESGDVVGVVGPHLIKADPKSLDVRWSSPLTTGAGGYGSSYMMLVPRGNRVAVVTESDIQFFDTANGARTGKYIYRNSGILEGACAAGKSQVVVYVLGAGTMRFDASTGTTAASGEVCKLHEVMGCPPGQSCGWERFRGSKLDCSYFLRAGNDTYRDCTTDDGTRRHVVVRTGGPGKPSWQIEGPSADVFFGVVDDTVVTFGSSELVAYAPATGVRTWNRTDVRAAATSNATTVFYGIDGTLEAAEAKTGRVLARMPGPKEPSKP